MEADVRTVHLKSVISGAGDVRLTYDESFEDTDFPMLKAVISRAGEAGSREFTVFYQKAMDYGSYSEYMSKHGCASCALTTVLRAFSDKHKDTLPQDVPAKIEKNMFSRAEWLINYKRPMLLQMPVTLLGISRILESEGIANRYVRSFSDAEAVAEMKAHLLSGRVVMVETSRKRRENGKIVDKNDKKYAGTNHTQVLLGLTKEGKVIYADSAGRPWSGSRQRLKEADLEDMINYMFPQQITSDNHHYYWGRKRTGGYILIDEPVLENL